MSPGNTATVKARWYVIPARVLLLTFLLTLLIFALSLLLGILWLVIVARLHGLHPNMTTAYRHVALPVTAIASGVILISTTVMEIRRNRQTKALAEIERTI